MLSPAQCLVVQHHDEPGQIDRQREQVNRAGQVSDGPGQAGAEQIALEAGLAVGQEPIGRSKEAKRTDRIAEEGLGIGPGHGGQAKNEGDGNGRRASPSQATPRTVKKTASPRCEQRIEQECSLHQADDRPLFGQPDQRKSQQGHAHAFAAIERAVNAIGTLLQIHPQQLIAVDAAVADHAFDGGEHSQTVAALDHARVGEEIPRQEKAKDQEGNAAVIRFDRARATGVCVMAEMKS